MEEPGNTIFDREASCAGFGRQIFDLYQLKKQKAEPLRSEGLVFTKLDPTGGVQVVKTRAGAGNSGDELLKAAKDIVNKAEILEPKVEEQEAKENEAPKDKAPE